MTPSPRIRRRLTGLDQEQLNYDPVRLDLTDPPSGWHVDDRHQELVSEAPGRPVADGSFAVAGISYASIPSSNGVISGCFDNKTGSLIVIDTSKMGVHALRDIIHKRVEQRSVGRISLTFESFGFKYGLPGDADFVFDARSLPNPYW